MSRQLDEPTKNVLNQMEHATNGDALRQAATHLSTLNSDQWKSLAAQFRDDKSANASLPNITFSENGGKLSADFHINADCTPNSRQPDKLVVTEH